MRLTHKSSLDALNSLIGGKEDSSGECWISQMPSKIGTLSNGLEFFSVEVTCSDGTQYHIPAYGPEAIELYRLARKLGVSIAIMEKQKDLE